MRRSLVLIALLAGMGHAHAADEPAPFEWTKEKFDLVAGGDAAEGKALAKRLRCKKCHNADGVSDDPDVPSIAGQRATYTYKQLVDFKNEVRTDRDMVKVARKMSEQDMADIAAWLHTLERPPMVGGSPLLVVKVCDSCHNEDIVEKDDHIEVAPVLKGQIRQYLENTMTAFKEADRSNDLFDRMQSVSHKLSDAEIKQLARYYGAEDIE